MKTKVYVLGFVLLLTGVFAVSTTLGQSRQLQIKQKQLEKATPVEPQPLALDQEYCRGDVEMTPARLTIRFGQDVLYLNQGQRGYKEILEDSSLIRPDGRVSAIVSYRLRNRTNKNLTFHVTLWQGDQSITSKEVRFSGSQTKTIQHNVTFQATGAGEYLRISVWGPVGQGGSDDTHEVYFNGMLCVRIVAL
jgi:hypothetical protein